MPGQPDVGDVHVNALLTNLSIAHVNAREHYIADQVFPLVGVDKQSDIYLVYNRGDFFQGAEDAQAIRNAKRAPGSRAAQIGYGINTSNTYRADNYAYGAEVPDELRGNADAPIQLDREATILVTEAISILRERTFALDFMVTGVWGTDVAGTTNFVKWSDYGGSDPLTDLEDGLDTIEGATGQRPNKLVMGAIVWRRLKHHPDFIDRIKGGATAPTPAKVLPTLLAQLLEIDTVLIGRASYRSSAEGAATLTLARILDDDALLLYAPDAPGMYLPAAGKTFFWRPLTGGAVQFIRKYRMEPERKDVIEAQTYFDQRATETQSGYFFSDAVD